MSIQYAHLEDPKTLDLKERPLRPIIEYGFLDKMLTEILPTILNGTFLLIGTVVIVIARALYKNSPVIILDEPTAALHPIAEQAIYNKFGEISAGKTALMISHRLSSTKPCDRVFVMEDGRITEARTHIELMQAEGGLYRQRYETQAKHYS